jgi:hypothetical protein
MTLCFSELNKLFRYEDSADYIENYLEWDDYRLTSEPEAGECKLFCW